MQISDKYHRQLFNALNIFSSKMFNALNGFGSKMFNALNRFGSKMFNALNIYERIANVANLILEIELPQLCGVDVANIRKLKSLLAVLASEYASSQADFLVDGRYTFEVGGKSKDGKQISGVGDSFIAADGIEHPFGNKIPLWCFGFLY